MFLTKILAGLAIVAVAGVPHAGGTIHAAPPATCLTTSAIEISVLGGLEEETWTFTAIGGLPYVICVDGDDSSDLDMWVSDNVGGELGRDTRITDECVVAFVARSTGTYSVRVKNLGLASNLYVLTLD